MTVRVRVLGLMALCAAGCSFDATGIYFTNQDAMAVPGDAAQASDAASADADRLDAVPTEPDASPPPDAAYSPDAPTPFCSSSADLVGCYRFDGTGADQSIYGVDAQITAASWGVGVADGALMTDAASVVHVAEHAGLDGPALTVELWVRPSQLPVTGGRAGLADNDQQWGLFLYEGGEIRCTCAGQAVNHWSLATDTWTHVACTYDATAGLILYIDGTEANTAPGNGLPSTAGASGLSIAGNNPSGDPFTGAIDDLRVWSRALSAAEICASAGSC